MAFPAAATCRFPQPNEVIMTICASPRQKRVGERIIENLAYIIAVQTRVPALAEGGTGEAKTQWVQQLAAAIEFDFYPLIGSCHAPEDFGGIPFPVYDEGHVVLLPMKWVRKTMQPRQLIFIDEVTTIPQQVRPVALSMLTERRIGETYLHPDTIICGACNPPELAPNAAPLEKSLLNRFYHHKWEIPRTSWLEGMRRDQSFPTPAVPVLPDNWLTYRGKWSALHANFIEAKPSMLVHEHSMEDERKSFPSPRAIQKAALLLAGAEAVDAPAETYVELLSGMVGEEYATEFFAYCASVELYDPEDIVEGRAKVKWDKTRFDVLACLPSAVLGAIRKENNTGRFGNAVKFFVELCEHEADLALYPLEELCPMMPKGFQFDRQTMTVFGDILRQVERS
jgi:hypothetical protein